MASKPLIVATLIGATVGVPYLASHTSGGQKSAATGPPAISAGSAPIQNGVGANLQTGTPAPRMLPPVAGAPVAPMNAVPGAQFTSVDQVIRFDVTREWVYQNWDRKS